MEIPLCSPEIATGSFNYVVNAYKSTSVIKSVVGSFTSPTDINLIIA